MGLDRSFGDLLDFLGEGEDNFDPTASGEILTKGNNKFVNAPICFTLLRVQRQKVTMWNVLLFRFSAPFLSFLFSKVCSANFGV